MEYLVTKINECFVSYIVKFNSLMDDKSKDDPVEVSETLEISEKTIRKRLHKNRNIKWILGGD